MLPAESPAVPPAGAREPAYRRFLRVLLPALAVAESLQVYPVAGSQMGIAAVTFIPVGALCLGDALASLRAWSAAQGVASLERLGEERSDLIECLAPVGPREQDAIEDRVGRHQGCRRTER